MAATIAEPARVVSSLSMIRAATPSDGAALARVYNPYIVGTTITFEESEVSGELALPNAPSVALHERLGFEKVAHFREVGWKFEQWVDVAYWQLWLPRR